MSIITMSIIVAILTAFGYGEVNGQRCSNSTTPTDTPTTSTRRPPPRHRRDPHTGRCAPI
jgi:hypothetical protein